MENPSENFITSFHSLEGVSISERKRNFFKLLNSNSNLKKRPEIVREIIEKLNPQTYLQQLFYLDILIYYKRTQELYSLLINENNDIVLSKIAKQKWFFREVFNENQINPDELLNTILPQFSYIIRMKILNILSKTVNDTIFDEIFDSINKRYGNFIANKFITGCSIRKIKTLIENKSMHLNLDSVQLITLYRKDKQFVEYYFEIKQILGFYTFERLLMFLFNNDFNLYIHLRNKYSKKSPPRLGRRATKRIVKLQREEIIDTPQNFTNYLDRKVIVRKLGPHSKQFVLNILRDDFDADLKHFSSNNLLYRLDVFPKRYQYDVFKNAVEKHYSIKIEDHPVLITSYLIQLVMNPDERHKLAKSVVDKTGKEKFIVYMNLTESIPRIKERINLTSDIYQRRQFILYLVDTLQNNNCTDENLLEVLKYVCTRHRNDDVNICSGFLSAIHQKFGLQNMNEKMWEIVNELLKMRQLKSQEDLTDDQSLAYIEYMYKQNKPVEYLLDKYFREQHHDITTYHQTDEFYKIVLLHKLKNYSFDESKYETITEGTNLTNRIYKWNFKNESLGKIDLMSYPELIKCLKNTFYLDDKYEYLTSNVSALLEIMWQFHLKTYLTSKRVISILRYAPHTPQKYNKLDEFLQIIASNHSENSQIMNLVKKCSHLNYDETIIKYSFENLSTSDKNIADCMVRCLSCLLPLEKFASFAESYKPTSKKVDLNDVSSSEKYKIQCAIASNYKNLKTYKCLPNLLNFAVGEYFESALRSLQSLTRRTPEIMLPKYIEILSGKAVSVRKHALFFTCELCDVSSFEAILIKLNESENTETLRKRFLGSTLKYFKKNPSEKFLELLKVNIRFTNKNDLELLKELSNPGEIPLDYQHSYIEFMWDFLELIRDKPTKFQELRNKLISLENADVIRKLSDEFCSNVINETLMNPMNYDAVDDTAKQFMNELLKKHPNRRQIFALILNTLTDRKLKNSDILTFLFGFVEVFMRTKDPVLLQTYLNTISSLINPLENFNYYLKEFFIKLKLQYHFEQFSIASFNTKIIDFMSDLIKNYGIIVLELFSEEFQFHLSQSYFCTSDVSELEFYKHLLDNHPENVNVAILTLQTLPIVDKKEADKYLLFLEIVDRLKRQTDPGVIVIFRKKFGRFI